MTCLLDDSYLVKLARLVSNALVSCVRTRLRLFPKVEWMMEACLDRFFIHLMSFVGECRLCRRDSRQLRVDLKWVFTGGGCFLGSEVWNVVKIRVKLHFLGILSVIVSDLMFLDIFCNLFFSASSPCDLWDAHLYW